MTRRFIGVVERDLVALGDRPKVEAATAAEVGRRIGSRGDVIGLVAEVVAEVRATITTNVVPERSEP